MLPQAIAAFHEHMQLFPFFVFFLMRWKLMTEFDYVVSPTPLNESCAVRGTTVACNAVAQESWDRQRLTN